MNAELAEKMEEMPIQIKAVVEGDKGDRVSIKIPPIYDAFQQLIKIYGDSYEPLKRALFYSHVGNVLKAKIPKELNLSSINLDELKNMIHCRSMGPLDTRINLFIPMKSGHGKKEFEVVISKTEQLLDFKYAVPTSYHSEQLVGKTIFRGKPPKSIPNLGYLSYDLLVFDEAIEFLKEPKYQQGRDYVNRALDPIGRNEVTKKSVDVMSGEEVKYYPDCTIVAFFQPVSLESHLVTRGLLRRTLIPFIKTSFNERMQALETTFEEKHDQGLEKILWNDWIVFLNRLLDKEHDWKFNDASVERILSRTKDLIYQGYQRGRKSAAYTDIMVFDLRNFLVKMSVIQAACHGREEIQVDDVERAYRDLNVFWELQLNFVSTKINGEIDYKDHLNPKLRECLNILDEKGCYSLEASCLSINQYDQLVGERLNRSETSVRQTYRKKLKDMGLLDCTQVGSHDSRVWLTEEGYTACHPNTLNALPPADEKI